MYGNYKTCENMRKERKNEKVEKADSSSPEYVYAAPDRRNVSNGGGESGQ